MFDLTPEIAADVLAACQAGAEEAAQAISRALDAEFEVATGEAGTLDLESLPEGFDAAGLALVFKFGEAGAAVAMIPESSGVLPDWYQSPDATGESKLSTLAQELSMLLFPETLMADDFKAGHVATLAEAITRGEPVEGAALVPLTLTSGEKQATLSLIWPIAAADAVLESAREESTNESETDESETDESEGAAENASEAAPSDSAPAAASGADEIDRALSGGFDVLPPYSRSLLKIKVPAVVNLAAKKQTINKILELGPGSIIKFEKSCEELLELTVGDCPLAMGEAVKVGDKFGLRISSITLPSERFKKVNPQRR